MQVSKVGETGFAFPPSMAEKLRDVAAFEVEESGGAFLLRPVDRVPGESVRDYLEGLDITDQDIEDAIQRARSGR